MPSLRLVLLAALALPQLAAGTTFTPTRFDDPPPGTCEVNDCSLREAMMAASVDAAADTVQLAAGTYTLTRVADVPPDGVVGSSGTLVADGHIVLQGAGRSSSVLTGMPGMEGFIYVGAVEQASSLTLIDLAIVGLSSLDGGAPVTAESLAATITTRRVDFRNNSAGVGAIVAFARVTVEDSLFENNNALNDDIGAVVFAVLGPMSVTDSAFVDNTMLVSGALQVGFPFVPQPSGLTLRNTRFTGNVSGGRGAAVQATAVIGVNRFDLGDTVFEDNHAAGDGGAVWIGLSDSGLETTRIEIAADGASFTGNSSDARCGALMLDVPSAADLLVEPTIDIDNSRFDGNSAASFGGALCATGDTRIAHTTFDGNSAGSQGGAIVSSGATLVIERSTLSDNESGSTGGALFSFSALIMEYSTVHGNRAGSAGGGGGLLISGTGSNLLRHVTITGNTANGAPNAVRVATSQQLPATVSYRSSILQGGCTMTDPAAIVANSYNIESPGNTCALSTDIGTFNRRNVTSQQLALGALADNGGPTLTRFPGADSVARNPGLSSVGTCSRRDQRDYAGTDNRCDVGAVEASAVPLPPEMFSDGFE